MSRRVKTSLGRTVSDYDLLDIAFAAARSADCACGSMSLKAANKSFSAFFPTVEISNGCPSPVMIQSADACSTAASRNNVGALGFLDEFVTMFDMAAWVVPICSAKATCVISLYSINHLRRSPMEAFLAQDKNAGSSLSDKYVCGWLFVIKNTGQSGGFPDHHHKSYNGRTSTYLESRFTI